MRQIVELVKEDPTGLSPEDAQVLSLEESEGGLVFGGGDPQRLLPGQSVLVFDAAVHSGATMQKAVTALRAYSAEHICSYSLILKRGSRFIPSLWGVMVDDEDRAYFLLEQTPNNRLTTHLSENHPYVHLRLLAQEDVRLPAVTCGVASLDRVTWGDRWFDMAESEHFRRTYLLESKNGLAGYLTLHQDSEDCLVIDEVAVPQGLKRRGYGGVLLRFADTLARHGGCSRVRLNAIFEKVDWYAKFGYRVLPYRQPIPLEDERYVPMERRLLYHLRC